LLYIIYSINYSKNLLKYYNINSLHFIINLIILLSYDYGNGYICVYEMSKKSISDFV